MAGPKQANAKKAQGDDPISKALALGSYFLSGCLAINVSQVLGAPLALVNSQWYDQWISFTKQQFAVLTMTLTQRWAPTVVKVSGDRSVRGQLFQTTEGDLLCLFPKRLVMIANHQIYTDWLYLWWIAYSNGMHGRIYIILKESLKRIPVIGWGMQLSQFIFLKRDWEQDKPQMASHLHKLDKPGDPMWLLLFPEGTNLAPSTREASAKWAAKNGIKDQKHTLLPRTTGLQFCLQELHRSIGYVYDCTIAYEGVPRGQYAQDVYTLHASYVNGKPPKCVHMYWRRFAVSEIPSSDDRKFELWLRARWMEKDALIEYWYKNGRFPADFGSEKDASGRTRSGAGYIESSIKASKWNDFLHQFMPMGLIAMVLFAFYGALPEILQRGLKDHPLLKHISDLPQARIQGFDSKTKTSQPIAAVAPGSQVKDAQSKAALLTAAKPKSAAPAQNKPARSTPAANPTSTTKPASTVKPAAANGPAQPRQVPKLRPRSPTPSLASAATAPAALQGRTARPPAPKLSSKAPSVAGTRESIARGTVPKLPPKSTASSVVGEAAPGRTAPGNTAAGKTAPGKTSTSTQASGAPKLKTLRRD